MLFRSVRENKGAGSSPYVADIISTSTSTEFTPANSEAAFSVYNGIVEHELIPEYQGALDVHIGEIDEATLSNIELGGFSDSVLTDFGDYSVNLVVPEGNHPIIENHLLTLNENSDKTIFFYLLENNVDHDGDGDVDEDGDGQVDEIEITINSLVVDNSLNESVYNHQINVINLIDQKHDEEEFSSIRVYFVKSDETIDTAENELSAIYATPREITLLNNTYSVYVIGKLNSSDIILSAQELTLNEESKDQFLILEKDTLASSGYKMTFSNQKN